MISYLMVPYMMISSCRILSCRISSCVCVYMCGLYAPLYGEQGQRARVTKNERSREREKEREGVHASMGTLCPL
jgi:hypothetical protein